MTELERPPAPGSHEFEDSVDSLLTVDNNVLASPCRFRLYMHENLRDGQFEKNGLDKVTFLPICPNYRLWKAGRIVRFCSASLSVNQEIVSVAAACFIADLAPLPVGRDLAL